MIITGGETVPNVAESEAQATTVAPPATAAATDAVTAVGKRPQATPAVRRIASEHNVRRIFCKSELLYTVYWKILAGQNTGEFTYLDCLEEKNLVNGLIWILNIP